ncbi:MAG: ribonuclease R family protein [Bryobacteraceae bacterium]
MTEAALLEHILKLPHGRANLKQLVRELGSKGVSRTEIERAVERLVERGDVIEVRPDHYVAASRSQEFGVGRLSVHRDGYAFLIPDRPMERIQGDIYIPAEDAERAMHGDRVLVRISRLDRSGRAEGKIVKILKRAYTAVVGEFRLTRRGCFVVPHDERIRAWIEIPEGLEVPPKASQADRIGTKVIEVSNASELEGFIVNVELIEYAERGGNAVGRVVEILGRPDDFGVDVEIMIRKHRLPHRFPPAVLEQAKDTPMVIAPAEVEGRRDFRSFDIVTIDGETARDFDDAVWVEKLSGGRFALHVHIADVSHYVIPGSPIDREARLRGTSVYFPDRAAPMLPYELSTNICSLNPQVDRLVMSALLEIDARGEVVKQEFTRGVIRSRERMTYTGVHLLLEGDGGLRTRYEPLMKRFELMQELAQILNRKRVRRGSIDFDLPEPLIEFDQWGAMTGVARSPRNIAHRLIEEFMLAANEAVAGYIEEAGLPSIYRIHEKPDPKRVLEFEEAARQFGYSLGVGAIPVRRHVYSTRRRDGGKARREADIPEDSVKITPHHYQKLVAKLEGKPEERILNYLMLRSLKQARYSTANEGHFALAAKTYTHFTSPIRRYPDLLVHRQLGALLDRREPMAEAELSAIAIECSQSERRAAEAERELVEWKKARFMEQRVGEVFDAMVISATRFGLFVELEDLFIEGLTPIDSLPGDRYMFHENVRKIIGERTRREFSIGLRVKVCLDRVDTSERKLQFSIYEPELVRAGRKKRRVVP